MNCKPGDLAVIVRTRDPAGRKYIGKVVTCVRIVEECYWDVDPALPRYVMVNDWCLRPIRDQDGDDETITWAGKPEKVGA